ncbi:MAG: DUF5606 domain-containing protein [Bacteroidales bacterium]|nr:DUF5606 domain-containing protein [Bacteroidales bacterium]
MDLSNILSITGKGGLFKLISKTQNNFIVESLEDNHRFPAFPHDGVATLDNIAIFTEDGEVSLQSVFQAIYKKYEGKNVEMPKDNNGFKTFFEGVLPDYDHERVYVSNIKKVILWYNILIDHQLIDLEDENENTENAPQESEQQ